MRYAVIPASEVEYSKQKAAHEALGFARKDLSLPDQIRIKWITYEAFAKDIESAEIREFSESIGGFFDPKEPNSIYILASQTKDALQKSVFHEVWHFNQRYKKTLLEYSEKTIEKFSYPYSEDALGRMKALPESELDKIYGDHLSGKDWSKNETGHGESAVCKSHADNSTRIYKKTGYIIR